MSEPAEVNVPNIGDFTGVEIIDILVKVGDIVKEEDPLITLESDKATIDIPAPMSGKITSIAIKVGDRVSEGDLILKVERIAASGPADADGNTGAAESGEVEKPAPTEGEASGDAEEIQAEVVVLGSGPGGYTAAFRAADLGKKTVLVERYPVLGGVCLNVGCIPSKALLHSAKIINEAREAAEFGLEFGQPKIDLGKLRSWKDKVVSQLTNGLKGLARQRKVMVIRGTGKFLGPNRLKVESDAGIRTVVFEQAVIAAGSQPIKLPGLPQDPRIMDSTSALLLDAVPGRLLVIGGGIIGLELATVFHELGAKITVVEMLDNLIPGADADIVKPLQKRIQKQYENIYLGTRVTGITAGEHLEVSFAGPGAPAKDSFDGILVAVGRSPNGHAVGADTAGVRVDDRGFIPVDGQQRTNVPHIFAIGDITGQPMLAHKASHEGKVAAEIAAGMKSAFDTGVIPSVAYTDPEVAWVGVTENDAAREGTRYGKGVFPWAASGRSLSLGRSEGITKLLFDEDTGRIIGAGICGPGAGELIAEAALAIEMGCDAHDIGLTIHAHPTLSETLAFAAEAFSGTITDLYIPKK